MEFLLQGRLDARRFAATQTRRRIEYIIDFRGEGKCRERGKNPCRDNQPIFVNDLIFSASSGVAGL
jgi:hypothetical protein